MISLVMRLKQFVLLALFGVIFTYAPLPARGFAAQGGKWAGTWASAQQIPEPQNALSQSMLEDASLREVVHLSAGGSQIRVHLSNAFGTAPLRFTSVHIGLPKRAGSADLVAGSDRALLFNGQAEVTIPAGAEYISDPVLFQAAPLSGLAITFHLEHAPAQQTGHPGSRATSFVVHGDRVSASAWPDAQPFGHWIQLAGVDVLEQGRGGSIVTLGDSITDGHGSTTNGNDRWPDVLARRLQANPATRNLGVLNAGIGGNRLLLDGLGRNALARFDRDVLAQAGAQYLIVLEGVNDLGTLTRDAEAPASAHAALVQAMIAGYRQIIERAHADGISVMGGTITPFAGNTYYHPGPLSEADRQAINAWIRSPGNFDGIVDFDRVVRDPAHPERLLPAFDSGDHLHPSPAGYAAMGAAAGDVLTAALPLH